MPVMFDDEAGGFAVISEDCEDCGEPRYETGCDAPGCDGFTCDNCGTGCDREDDPGGRCARAADAESDADYAARVNRERVAFGLSPVTAEGKNAP